MRVVALVAGPEQHGVVRHGLSLANAGGGQVYRDIAEVAGLPAQTAVVAEFADRLFGATAEAGALEWRALADRVHAADGWLVASLHDVPVADGSPLAARRTALYRTVVESSDAVLVASGVERERLLSSGIRPPRLAVVPLPVPPAVARPLSRPTTAESVTVLGFLYPGKGHEEVVTAMAASPALRQLPLVCAGRASDGHDDLVVDLRARHADVLVTGFLPDAALAPMLQAATIPVAPNRVIGSSASILTWWAHGRRPLVPDVPLVRELAAAVPDALIPYGTTADLADALSAAVADPGSTWLPGDVVPGPTTRATAVRRFGVVWRWFA